MTNIPGLFFTRKGNNVSVMSLFKAALGCSLQCNGNRLVNTISHLNWPGTNFLGGETLASSPEVDNISTKSSFAPVIGSSSSSELSSSDEYSCFSPSTGAMRYLLFNELQSSFIHFERCKKIHTCKYESHANVVKE